MRRLLPGPAGSDDTVLDDTVLDDAGLFDAYRVPDGRHLRVNFIASLDGAPPVSLACSAGTVYPSR